MRAQEEAVREWRFNFVGIPTAKHITREVVDARRPLGLLVAVPQDDCPSKILFYFDLNVDHTNATYEAIIECCKFMQQSGDYGKFHQDGTAAFEHDL